LVVLLAAADPALAHEENIKGEPANGPPSGPCQDGTATLSFELAGAGEPPPEGTEFFGFVPTEGGISAPPSDPDGDGPFTGNIPTNLTPAGDTHPRVPGS
jgi:hypothetical protein